MAELAPFRALLYNERHVGDLAGVVTPPHDVISPWDQERFYQTHPHNFIRLILGRKTPRDHQRWNRYLRAQRILRQWMHHRVVKYDRSKALYLYAQEFMHEGKKVTRLGCLAALRLEPYQIGRIMPHEDTFEAQVRDRLELLRATRTDLSPVFAVALDRSAEWEQKLHRAWQASEPLLQVDTEGVRHTLRRVVKPEAVRGIQDGCRDRPVVIADGHHRYEAALRYRHELEKRGRLKLQPGAAHVMTCVMSSANEGMTILPTHRLVKTLAGSVASVLARLKSAFVLTHCPDGKTVLRQLRRRIHPTEMGLVIGEAWYMLRPRHPKVLAVLEDAPPCWRELDAVVLHELVFRRLLGLPAREEERRILYTRDEELAASLVRQGEYAAGFFLAPPSFETIYNVAASGYRMPRKTTYFYPKLLAGLAVYVKPLSPRRQSFARRRFVTGDQWPASRPTGHGSRVTGHET